MTQLRPKSLPKLSFLAVSAMVLLASAAFAQPSFQQTLSHSTIGPGSISTVTFTITNGTGSPVTNLAFNDNLPAGMTVADPAAGTNSCLGVLSASSGGTSISYSGGAIGGSSSCSIRVNVTASGAGTYTNTTGDLTSTAGNSGSSSAALTVDTGRPGFTKSFSPSPATFNARVRLTLTIDNSANASQRVFLSFTDTLPSGMTVASPSNLSNTCGSTASASGGSVSLAATAGGLNFSTVAAGGTCSVGVDVIAGSVGSLANLSGELVSQPGPFGGPQAASGKAGATLSVFAERLSLTKSFVNDPVAPGDTVNLQFNLTNLDRRGSVTDVTFTDDLDAALSGLVAVSLPSNPCGVGSVIAGSDVLTLTGGNLNPEASCSFTVGLQVPASASGGSYLNTTSSVLGDSGGSTVSGQPASDTLFVEAAGVALTKTFLDNPVGAGGSTELEFTLTNTGSSAASDIAFVDEFDTILPTASAVPAAGFCNGTGSATYQPLFDPPAPSSVSPARLTISDASLGAGESCTFSITLNVEPTATPGFVDNTTSEVTATIDGETVTSDGASDVLQIIGGPVLNKEFIDDPVLPGDSVTLEFRLSQSDSEGAGNATAITFSDDLSAALSGLAASSLPADGFCGEGSQITGTTTLSIIGASLAPGETCTFSVTVDVPAAAAAGVYTNTTSSVTADVDGVVTTTTPASGNLLIAGVSMIKEFIDDPALPGGAVTLRYTIDNVGSTAATDMSFVDDYDAVIDNMTASTLPAADSCGAGSVFLGQSGNRRMFVAGASLAAGASCTFDVVLSVPAGAADGFYPSTTSNFFATIGGSTVVLVNASDLLEVTSEVLGISKEFIDDPVTPGGVVTLRFTVTNLSGLDVTEIAFTDDLDAVLATMASVSGTLTDPCGPGSDFGGTTLLTLSGGMLSGGESCTFDVAVNVPSEVGEGPWVNVTSEVTGEASGVPVSGGPATDELQIAALTLSKAFGTDIAQPGDTVSLTFTIANDGSETATGLSFNDNLNAMLAGLEATGLPLTDICGEGSQIDGLGSLSFVDGSVPPNGSCTFSVDVVVPASAAPGVYVNVTEELRQESLTVGDRATASLEISGLSLSKSFSSATAQAGDLVMLTFTIANSGASTASELAFVDDLDAMLSGLEAVGLPLADPCGSGSELDGTSYLTFLGGSLPAGGSCTFSVNVAIPESAVAGVYENVTSELTRGGDEVAGPASATLEIIVIGPIDTDGDGVFDGVDVCEGTVIPESVPTHHLKPNRYALVDSDFIFDTEPPPGGGGGPGDVFTTTDTGGCSCEQIIVALGLGQGHVKFGCAVGVMRNWVNLVAFGPDITMDSFDDGTLDGWNVVD